MAFFVQSSHTSAALLLIVRRDLWQLDSVLMRSIPFVVVSEHLLQPYSLSGGDGWVGECGVMLNPKALAATLTDKSAHNPKIFHSLTTLTEFDGDSGVLHLRIYSIHSLLKSGSSLRCFGAGRASR